MLVLHNKTNKRAYKEAVDALDIYKVVKSHCLNTNFFIKHAIPPISVFVSTVNKEGFIKVVTKQSLGEELHIFLFKDIYFELYGNVVLKESQDNYVVKLQKIYMATDSRKNQRHKVNNQDIYAVRIRSSRHKLKVSSQGDVPTSVKIHFSDLEKKFTYLAESVAINTYHESQASDLIKLICTSGKYLFVPDTQNIESYLVADDNEEKERINYVEYLHLSVQNIMSDYRKRGVLSELIYPIIHTTRSNEKTILGYISLISKNKYFTKEVLSRVTEAVNNMIQLMRDANTLVSNEREMIHNISLNGMLLEIRNKDLQESLLGQDIFTSDIVFKLQQPITMSLRVIYILESISSQQKRDVDAPLIFFVGVQIIGSSLQDTGLSRYKEMIEAMT